MNYKYIADNNLEYVQTYMYSEYGGVKFLQAYYESRKKHIIQNFLYDKSLIINRISRYVTSDSSNELYNIWNDMNESTYGVLKTSVDKYVKRFEFRKRIYEKYTSGKADLESRYDDSTAYILVGGVLTEIYGYTHNLKYLNCLLKVTDTLLSITDKIEPRITDITDSIITKEFEYVSSLMADNDIEVELC